MSELPRLLLDGVEEDVLDLSIVATGSLARDPFASPGVDLDDLLGRFVSNGGPFAPERRSAHELLFDLVDTTPELEGEASAEKPPAPRRLRPRSSPRVPRLAEVDAPQPSGWLDRFLGDDERRRVEALASLVPEDVPYDRFGFSPATLRSALPFALAIYRAWFRVRSSGHENLPAGGAAILAANHGGLLPFDGAMTVADVLLHTDPPRLLRSVVDRWAGELPFVNVFFARVGQVVGTRENFVELLEDGQLVLVFPEGMAGIRKTVAQRHRLQAFHVGFVELALRHRVPIVPTAVIGSDDQAPILFDLQPIARRLGLPMLPITPTFPWLGPLGLLPYPVPYRIVYGEPLLFHERFGPEGAEDARLVRYLASQVRRVVQGLVDRHRS